MNRKWSYFIGAAALAAIFLLGAGAPLLPVAAGIGAAALLMGRRSRAT